MDHGREVHDFICVSIMLAAFLPTASLNVQFVVQWFKFRMNSFIYFSSLAALRSPALAMIHFELEQLHIIRCVTCWLLCRYYKASHGNNNP